MERESKRLELKRLRKLLTFGVYRSGNRFLFSHVEQAGTCQHPDRFAFLGVGGVKGDLSAAFGTLGSPKINECLF